MKDNFSVQAKDYAQFRPHYPSEMIEYIVSLTTNKNTALDVATGNGQVAAELARHFEAVYATDISEKQLENATQAGNLVYKAEPAEQTSFQDGMFDLVTVAQAIHWFDFDAFYKEIFRILKPDGLFAVMGYGLLETNPDSDAILRHFYYDITGPYWDPERRYLDENYKTIPFPFHEISAENFSNTFTWSFEQLTGYLNTWSAVQHYIRQNGTNPLNLIYDDLEKSWGKSDGRVTFPLLLRLGKLKS